MQHKVDQTETTEAAQPTEMLLTYVKNTIAKKDRHCTIVTDLIGI